MPRPTPSSSADALCGGSFTVAHLDGRQLRVLIRPGEVIQPGTYKMVADGAWRAPES